MAALIKDFTERHLRQRRKHPEYAERILQKELAEWAHRDARTIKPREVIELLDAIVDRPAPVMANRVAGSVLLANLEEVAKRAKRTGIAIRLILLTAVRRSELTAARWSELDLGFAAAKRCRFCVR